MITKEINDWVRKVETGNYSAQDIMYEFSKISKYLTREELIQIKNRLQNSCKK